MTTQTAPRIARPARSNVRLDAPLRALRCEVSRWALAAGQPLNLDAITIILGARHHEAVIEGSAFSRWTTNTVLTFLYCTVDDWCARNQVERSAHVGESLLTYMNFLSDSRVLSSGSSPIRQLRTTIADLAGLTDGRYRPGEMLPVGPTPLHPGFA